MQLEFNAMIAKATARRFHAVVEVCVNEKTISIMLCLIELSGSVNYLSWISIIRANSLFDCHSLRSGLCVYT